MAGEKLSAISCRHEDIEKQMTTVLGEEERHQIPFENNVTDDQVDLFDQHGQGCVHALLLVDSESLVCNVCRCQLRIHCARFTN